MRPAATPIGQLTVPSARTGLRQAGAVVAGAFVLAACSGGGPDPAVVERGAALYGASCMRCHGGPEGGAINDIPPRHNAVGHTWHHPDCLLEEIVRDGLPARPGAAGTDREMPAFGNQLDDEDIDAILTYLKTWWTEGQRASQAEVTEANCDVS